MRAVLPVLLFFAWVTAAKADFDSAAVAYARGDYATAFQEFERLTEQGDAGAQFNLGVMYYRGDGVPQDYAQAVHWINLAAAQGDEDARKAREALAGLMTPGQVAEAQRLSREFRPR